MTGEAFIDKLLDMSRSHAAEISNVWHKAVIENPRTATYGGLNRDVLIHQATTLYKNLKSLFFSNDPYAEVEKFLDSIRYADYAFENNVPLYEAIYALIVMRRHIWLHAETQAILYNNPLEIYQSLESTNRTILLFDYAIVIVIQRYEELAKAG